MWLSSVIFLANLLDHNFQSLNSANSIWIRKNGGRNIGKSFIFHENSNPWCSMSFWLGVRVRRLIRIYLPYCFTIEGIWTYHSIGAHSTPGCYFSQFNLGFWITLGFPGPRVRVFWVFTNPATGKTHSSYKYRSDIRNWIGRNSVDNVLRKGY